MYATYLCRWRFGWARKALGADEPQRVIETAEEALALWSAADKTTEEKTTA